MFRDEFSKFAVLGEPGSHSEKKAVREISEVSLQVAWNSLLPPCAAFSEAHIHSYHLQPLLGSPASALTSALPVTV